ncbi:Hypothetical predicted protein [Marmota monax]|uniref:Peptidase M12B domain-containing protein n=1 Tax=Marmota monax TaxID=9995 RepID=A0A5E4C0S8_MARMO|nr:hypothetical protein GHT09_002684 [Marmota monax]VTJ75388.1 Hypothetical predicted protein [Marmota monax]
MGFIQLNEDFIFIEPLNDTMAITGHPHRVYRQKRSVEEKATEKSALHSHYCGIISDLYIGHHGEKMLESFCKWQHEEFGKKNDIHLEMSTSWGEDLTSVDAAVLITRKDFCVHKDEPCDTVGIAYLNGMCSEKRKCIIAEDNGLNLAFTIAHEMGHKLGSEARDCNGPRKQYRICENPPCPAGLPGFRDWQCQAYSVRTSYPKHVLQWQAVLDEEKPCALFCSPVGKEQPILLSEKVMDGTACGYQGLDICANGRCQKVGCDGLLGSLAREDHCGVCNGNGKSCKIIKGDFNHTRGAGYVEVLVIPAGARRIKVVEEKPAHSYLALRDSGKQSINSDWKIEHSGAFNLAGTTVHYVRRGLWEKISAKGPTTTPLHLLV